MEVENDNSPLDKHNQGMLAEEQTVEGNNTFDDNTYHAQTFYEDQELRKPRQPKKQTVSKFKIPDILELNGD